MIKKHMEVVNGQVMVELAGHLYVGDVATVREDLIRYTNEGYSRFVINMAELKYIDSAGLGALISIQKRALDSGGGVVIKGLQGSVKDLFKLTRLDNVFDLQ